MAKNSYKANVNQYANQEEAIRKAKGNPNKNIHSKKKNSNYGGYTTGAYMAQKVAEKVNQQEKVKLPTWLNVTLIAEFAVVLVILIVGVIFIVKGCKKEDTPPADGQQQQQLQIR